MIIHEYTCAVCERDYSIELTQEEWDEHYARRRQECIDNFGVDPQSQHDEVAQICDTCYKAMTIGGKPINFN